MTETAPTTLAIPTIAPEEALSACLAWLCTPRGGNNFYGRILNGCNRRFSPGMGTMAVALTKRGKYTFLCDPDFIVSIPEPMRMMVLVHEAGHLVYGHLERMLALRHLAVDERQFRALMPIYNVAADMAVNDVAVRPLLNDVKIKGDEFRDKFIWPETRGYPPGKSMEDYLVLLIKELQEHDWKAPKQGDGDGSGDGNGGKKIVVIGGSGDSKGSGGGSEQGENAEGEGADEVTDRKSELNEQYPQWFNDMVEATTPNVMWVDVFDEATQGEIERALDQAKDNAKSIVRKAVESAEKSRGTVPAHLKKIIENLLEEATIPWQQVLRMQMKSSISRKMGDSMVLPSMALINADWCEPYPGLQPEMTFNIMAFFDTSGSMSDTDFMSCCSELAGLVQTEEGVNVRLVMFDAGLQHEEDVSTDDQDFQNLRAKARYGYGGTSFEEPVKYLIGNADEEDWVEGADRVPTPMYQVDLGIIFTDGYAPMPSFQPTIPLIWCLTSGGAESPEMLQVVWMK